MIQHVSDFRMCHAVQISVCVMICCGYDLVNTIYIPYSHGCEFTLSYICLSPSKISRLCGLYLKEKSITNVASLRVKFQNYLNIVLIKGKWDMKIAISACVRNHVKFQKYLDIVLRGNES